MQCEKIIVDVYGEKKEFFYKKNLNNRNSRRRFLFESKDGDTYEGTLDEENNFKKGKLTQKNGDYQDGLWENGKFISGKGKSTYSDGVYIGDYKNGDMNGKGEYLFNNGHTVDCTFVNGNFIKDYTIRERHHELCIVLVAAHDHDNEDKKRYSSLTEYNKMIKNKYNYERSDNLGFVVPHHEISGDYDKKEIDEELLTEQIGDIEWLINNRISRNNTICRRSFKDCKRERYKEYFNNK